MSSETARWDSLTGAEVWAIGALKHPAERSLDQRRLMLSPTYTASLSRSGERRRVEEDLAAAPVQNRQPEGEHAQGDELADRDVVPGLERHLASQAGETQIPEKAVECSALDVAAEQLHGGSQNGVEHQPHSENLPVEAAVPAHHQQEEENGEGPDGFVQLGWMDGQRVPVLGHPVGDANRPRHR